MDPYYATEEAQQYYAGCDQWQLNESDVISFFETSQYLGESGLTNSNYDMVTCARNGTLLHMDKEWEFFINAGGLGTWANGEENIFFGCGVSQDYWDDEVLYEIEQAKLECLKYLPEPKT